MLIHFHLREWNYQFNICDELINAVAMLDCLVMLILRLKAQWHIGAFNAYCLLHPDSTQTQYLAYLYNVEVLIDRRQMNKISC